MLAHGFLRLRCGDFGHDKRVTFSCKRRGFCPSCGVQRMTQTAAHLVGNVIPHCLVLDGVSRRSAGGTSEFVEAAAQPTRRCGRCSTRSSTD